MVNGRSGSTFSTPIWLSQLSASLNFSLITDLQLFSENHRRLRTAITFWVAAISYKTFLGLFSESEPGSFEV